jgi:hypothetical protein
LARVPGARLLLVLAFAMAIALAPGALFTWTGEGYTEQCGIDWNCCYNWGTCYDLNQYPDACGEDTYFPDGGEDDDSDDWGVNLINNALQQQVGHMLIEEDVLFGPAAGALTPILVVKSVTVNGEGEQVKVGFLANSLIRTAGCL